MATDTWGTCSTPAVWPPPHRSVARSVLDDVTAADIRLSMDELRELAAIRDEKRGLYVWARVKATYAEAGVRFDWPAVARTLLCQPTAAGSRA